MTSVLAKVTYLLFESELSEDDEYLLKDEHIVDREIRLDWSDGSVKHISWTSDPIQYCVGVQAHSWFMPGNAKEVDMSSRSIWKELVGNELKLQWHDESHQVLELCTNAASIYLSSRENGYWEADTITVSRAKPQVPSNKSLERTREG
jgi:hypothetical protein